MIALLALLTAVAHATEPLGYEAWVRATAWTTPELEAEAHAKRVDALGRLEAIVGTLQGESRVELELRMGQMLLEEGIATGEAEVLERAAAAFDAVLQVERHSARDEALLGRGRALHALGRDEPAVASLERLLAKDPPSSWVPEAMAVLAETRTDEARRELLVEAAEYRGTAAAWAHYRLGWIDHQAGIHLTERMHFGAAIELHPGAIQVVADTMGLLHAYERPQPSARVAVPGPEPVCADPVEGTPTAWVQATWCWYDQRDQENAERLLAGLEQRFGRGSWWWKRASREERKAVRRYIRQLDDLIRR